MSTEPKNNVIYIDCYKGHHHYVYDYQRCNYFCIHCGEER